VKRNKEQIKKKVERVTTKQHFSVLKFLSPKEQKQPSSDHESIDASSDGKGVKFEDTSTERAPLRNIDFKKDREKDPFGDVEQFLNNLELAHYVPIFKREAIDNEHLNTVTNDKLIGLKIATIPRNKILNAIEQRKKPPNDNISISDDNDYQPHTSNELLQRFASNTPIVILHDPPQLSSGPSTEISKVLRTFEESKTTENIVKEKRYGSKKFKSDEDRIVIEKIINEDKQKRENEFKKLEEEWEKKERIYLSKQLEQEKAIQELLEKKNILKHRLAEQERKMKKLEDWTEDLLTTIHNLSVQKTRDYNMQFDKDFRYARGSDATILPDIFPNGQPPAGRITTPKRTPTNIPKNGSNEEQMVVIEPQSTTPLVPRSPIAIPRTNSIGSRPKAKAIYTYSADGQRELGFDKGDILTILSQDSKGWWYAQSTANPTKTGFVPSNYLELI